MVVHSGAVCILFACSGPQPPADDPLAAALTDSLRTLIDSSAFVGVGVAITGPNDLHYAHGFGMADVERNVPYDEHTVQTVGSVSKTLIGLAVMKVVDQGALQLDGPVNAYLPFEVVNPTHPDVPITVRHLVTHTSTITDTEMGYLERVYVMAEEAPVEEDISEALAPVRFNAPDSAVDMANYLQRTLARDGAWYDDATFLRSRPGERFTYSNIGATLAAYVVERATGMSFDAYTKKHILEPLGMQDSYWQTGRWEDPALSQLFFTPTQPFPRYRLITYADGGFATSSADMARYVAELTAGHSGKGRLLSPDAYAELFRQQLDSTHFEERGRSPYSDEYNMGVFMGYSMKGYFGHTGGDPGLASQFFVDPGTGIGRYLVVNTDVVRFREFVRIWEMMGRFSKRMAGATEQ